MAQLSLAHVGCGGMGLRHMYGLIELKERGFDTFDLVAVCDLHESAADHIADLAESVFPVSSMTSQLQPASLRTS